MSEPRTTVAAGDPVSHSLQPFWELGRQGVLALPRCDRCGAWVWYPRAFCPRCGSEELTWTRTGGGGTVYSYTVVRRPARPYTAPYVLAYVELDEGVRILTHVRDAADRALHVGMRVTAVFDEGESDAVLLRFRPERSIDREAQRGTPPAPPDDRS